MIDIPENENLLHQKVTRIHWRCGRNIAGWSWWHQNYRLECALVLCWKKKVSCLCQHPDVLLRFYNRHHKKDVKGLDQLLMKRMREQLIQDKFFSETEKALHLMTGAEVRFIKTNNNKKVIGRINDFVYTFKVHLAYKYENLSEMNVVYENGLFNSHITGQYGDKRRTLQVLLAI